MERIDLGWSFSVWLLMQGTWTITYHEWGMGANWDTPKSQKPLQRKELMGWVVPCAAGGYKNLQKHLALWLWGNFLLALESSISFSSVHAGEAGGTKKMGHSMRELCLLPGTIHSFSCWRREEENGNKAVHKEKKFFLAPESTGKGNAVIVVGTKQSSLEHGLTCWSVRNALSANSFENVRREM